jgi:hypothetical protein
MTIDAKELREAIFYFEGDSSNGRRLDLLVEAASAYAATLPREVTFTRYLVVTDLNELGPYPDKDESENIARRRNGIVVPLSGTALLPPREKD